MDRHHLQAFERVDPVESMAVKTGENKRILPWRDEVLGIDAEHRWMLSRDESYLLVEFFLLLLQLLLSQLVTLALFLLLLPQHLLVLLADKSVLPGFLDVAIANLWQILGLSGRRSGLGEGECCVVDNGASGWL